MHIKVSFAASRGLSKGHFQLFLMPQDSVLTNSTVVLSYVSCPSGDFL